MNPTVGMARAEPSLRYVECGALAPLSARDFSPRRKAMDNQTLNGGRDKHVPPEKVPPAV